MDEQPEITNIYKLFVYFALKPRIFNPKVLTSHCSFFSSSQAESRSSAACNRFMKRKCIPY